MGEPDTKAVPRVAPGSGNRATLRPVTITAVTVKKVTATTSHRLLHDNSKNWTFAGLLIDEYTAGHWQDGAHNHPWTHTRGLSMNLEVRFDIQPSNAASETLRIEGTGPDPYLKFVGQVTTTAGAGSVTVKLTSASPLPNVIQILREKKIKWTAKLLRKKPSPGKADAFVETGKSFDAGTSGPHTIYVTYDTPIVTTMSPAGTPTTVEEDGVTVKRMEGAINLLQRITKDGVQKASANPPPQATAAGLNDPHEIARWVMKIFPRYVLQPYVDTFADLYKGASAVGCPVYHMSRLGGAWPLMDHLELYGECQAMARFVRAVLGQVGIPSEVVIVWAGADWGAEKNQPQNDRANGRLAREDPLVGTGKGQGLHSRSFSKKRPKKKPDGTRYEVQLVQELMDGKVKAGQFITPGSDGEMSETEDEAAMPNEFEACLKLTAGRRPGPGGKSSVDDTRYYPAGVLGGPSYHTAQEVLVESFHALCWVEPFIGAGGVATLHVDKVIATKDDWKRFV